MVKKEDVVFDVDAEEIVDSVNESINNTFETINETLPKSDKATVKSISTVANGDIFKKINNIMQDLPAIGKNSKNTQQNFWFRGIDAVMNVLNPLFTKHGLFVVPTILDQKREERQTKNGGLLIYSIVTVKYTFYSIDGSYIEAIIIGEGMDSADKATNKAMSIAFKYACFQVFCIPTEEMVDPDGESPDPVGKELKAKVTKIETKPVEPVKKEEPVKVEESTEMDTIKKEIITLAKSLGGSGNEKVNEITIQCTGEKNPNKCNDLVKLQTLKSGLEKLSKEGGK